jgi:hypothetical protein
VIGLKELVTQLQSQLQELQQSKREPPSFVKSNRHQVKREKKTAPRKKRAAEGNHGRKSEAATEIRQHGLEHCPECGYKLSGQSIGRRRQVIDLPTVQPVQVVEHQVLKRYCPHCQKWREPKLDLSGEVLGQGRLGVRVMSLVAWLRTELRLPDATIQRYLEQVHGLRISVGEVVALAHKVASAGADTVTAIKHAITRSPQVHMDETTWRENGDNGYVWAASTPTGYRYYEYALSRSGTVAEQILGADFHGTLSSDFYAGYNWYSGLHQRCWIHLLRDMHELDEAYGCQRPEVRDWLTHLKRTYTDGVTFVQHAPPPTQPEREQFFHSLVQRVQDLGLKWPRDKGHPAQALCKRILRHDVELFQFVRQAGLSPDNNLAERSVRPLVIARKVSGGTRSQHGSATRMNLQTLFATWSAHGHNALSQCLSMLGAIPLLPAV